MLPDARDNRLRPRPDRDKGSRPVEGLRVLVVDDDPDNREILSTLLTQHGVRVETAASAACGLEKISANPPDVLVSDIGMPGMDGYGLIQEMRKLPGRAAAIPAIAVTAFARAQDRAAILDAGFNAYLAKPFAVGELLSIMANVRQLR